MFYSVDIGYDLCGPPIAKPSVVVLKERKSYVIRVVKGGSEAPADLKESPAGVPAEEKQSEKGKEPADSSSETTNPEDSPSGTWKPAFTDDENIARIVLLGPAGEVIPGRLFFDFSWSPELESAINTGKAPSDGGEAVMMEGTLDEAVHRAALMILKKGRQGNFCINIFGHKELPAGIPLGVTLTAEQAEEMQSDDSYYADAAVMVNNMEIVLFQAPHPGEDEEKILRRRISKYSWWQAALPKDYAIYTVRKVSKE